MEGKRRIAIGMENYKEIIDKNFYYVDKTLLIRDLLDKGGKVNLFTRPRRFGKTLALSMIRTFFEKDIDYKGEENDNSHYFEEKKIMEAGEAYVSKMGQYPVIALSLKSAKQPEFDMAYHVLRDEISKEFSRHRYILCGNGVLDAYDREKYEAFMNRKAEKADYAISLQFLSRCLSQYHQEKVIILLDEYDVPLENAYFEGFYNQMTGFIRSLFESALKTNEHLEFAVITGCLRISRESIFTGLNNMKIVSILNPEFGEYFGFTQEEVDVLFTDNGVVEKKDEAKKWYDGYLFGECEVYNPWSVLNYVEMAVADKNYFPRPYWANTSANSIIRELVEKADSGVKKEIEELIAGRTIEKSIHEDITYEEIYQSQNNLWNFLFFTGYLKKVSERFEVDTVYLGMKIPNEEVRYVYRNTIREWFEQKIKQTDFTRFYQAVLEGNIEDMAGFMSAQLASGISYYDNAESFYHGYLFGVLSRMEGYEIHSNKERGNGRPDLVLLPFHPKNPAIIMELKRAEKFTMMESMCDVALKQIEEKDYATEILDEGYQQILKYGICFCKKSCMVKKQE